MALMLQPCECRCAAARRRAHLVCSGAVADLPVLSVERRRSTSSVSVCIYTHSLRVFRFEGQGLALLSLVARGCQGSLRFDLCLPPPEIRLDRASWHHQPVVVARRLGGCLDVGFVHRGLPVSCRARFDDCMRVHTSSVAA